MGWYHDTKGLMQIDEKLFASLQPGDTVRVSVDHHTASKHPVYTDVVLTRSAIDADSISYGFDKPVPVKGSWLVRRREENQRILVERARKKGVKEEDLENIEAILSMTLEELAYDMLLEDPLDLWLAIQDWESRGKLPSGQDHLVGRYNHMDYHDDLTARHERLGILFKLPAKILEPEP